MAPEKGIIYSGEICNFIASLPGTLTIYTLLLIFEVRGDEIGPKMLLWLDSWLRNLKTTASVLEYLPLMLQVDSSCANGRKQEEKTSFFV